MIQKRIIYRRKLKGFLRYIFFSLTIALGAFLLFFSVWIILKNHAHLLSAVPTTVSTKKSQRVLSEIETLCQNEKVPCANIVVHTDTTATFTVDGNGEVILSLEKDIATQIASLQLTIANLTIEGKRFSRLDFRFDKPVISY